MNVLTDYEIRERRRLEDLFVFELEKLTGMIHLRERERFRRETSAEGESLKQTALRHRRTMRLFEDIERAELRLHELRGLAKGLVHAALFRAVEGESK